MAEYNLWTKYDLQEVWVYSMYGFGGMEQDDKAETTAVRTNQCENPAEFWESLKEANIQVVSLKKALMEGAIPRQSTLFVTDCPEVAQKLSTADFPVLGILRKENKDASFSGVRYLAEGWESITPSYLERVYRRCRGLPWQILETKRCILRETIEADVDAFYRIYEEPSITAFMENLFADREEELRYTADYRKNMYEFYGYGIWSVILKETGEVIGRAGLDMRRGFEEPELGFVIGVLWQRRGIAEEVCRAILRYGEEELGFTRVQALTEQENRASLALLKKLGFVFAGVYEEMGKEYLRHIKG
ncbi:MAG: GNAT family N-acetyltransferase [Lachnospiraceae bacterium]